MVFAGSDGSTVGFRGAVASCVTGHAAGDIYGDGSFAFDVCGSGIGVDFVGFDSRT